MIAGIERLIGGLTDRPGDRLEGLDLERNLALGLKQLDQVLVQPVLIAELGKFLRGDALRHGAQGFAVDFRGRVGIVGVARCDAERLQHRQQARIQLIIGVESRVVHHELHDLDEAILENLEIRADGAGIAPCPRAGRGCG